jgi:hypothetical protein
MAVNRDGFLRFSPSEPAAGIGLYRFPGGDFWQQYTVGAFVLFDDKPAALLYRDDRFLESDAPLPSPRLWTFDQHSNEPQAIAMPSLDAFAPQDGWNVDALRRGADGNWYFRAARTADAAIRMFRSHDLASPGEQVSLGAFQNASLPEPLSAAPGPLQEMLAAAFAGEGGTAIAVVSPEFPAVRFFAANRESPAIAGFYSGGFFLAADPQGNAVYVEQHSVSTPVVRRFSLPPLPEGFVYTGIALIRNTIVASWEEQEGYSIGAAGFMVITL